MKKRILSLALASAMAVGTVSGAFAETEVTKWANVPYVQGNEAGEFMPNSDITRQEIAVMIGKALELEGSNPDFKDADKIAAWASEFVAGLQDAEIVEGDDAGNFNPTNKITRAELATMVVRAYENATGEELSAGDASFDDVSDSAWYASAVKKAAEAGLVLGDGTGNFNPAGNATRAQTVVMVNRMLGLGEDNLPSNVAEVLETELNDSDEWPSWAVDAILVASTAFEYTVGEDGKIVIILKVSVDSVSVATAEDVATVSAVVKNAEAGAKATVEIYANGDTTAAPAATKEVEIVDGKVSAEFAGLPAGDHVARVKVGEASKDANFTIEITELAVQSVSAINAKQIKVTFNKAVDSTTAKDVKNYSLRGVGATSYQALSATTTDPNYATAELSEDKKVVTITLATNDLTKTALFGSGWTGLKDGDTFRIKVESIKDTSGVALESAFETSTVYTDKVAPTLVSASAKAKTSTNTITLKFSEPVDRTSATVMIDGKATALSAGDNVNEIKVTSGTALTAGTTYNLSVLNVKDIAGNLISPNPVSATVTVEQDTNAPTVTEVKVIRDNLVEVTFDKSMDVATVANIVLLDANYSATGLTATTTVKADTSNKTFNVALSGMTFNSSGVFSGHLSFKDGLKDSAGNAIAPTTKSITLNKDTAAPAIVSASYKKLDSYAGATNTGKGFIVVKFNEDVTNSSANTAYKIINDLGANIATPISAVRVNADDKTELVLSLNAAVSTTEKSYTVILPVDAARDLSSQANQSAAANVTVDVSAGAPSTTDTIAPVLATATETAATSGTSGTSIALSFTETGSGLDNATVIDVNNYRLDGAPLPAGSYVVVTGATTATINIPAGTIAKSKDYSLNASNIKDKAGNVMTPFVDTAITLKDDVKPELTTAVLNSNGTISLGFSEDMAAASGKEAGFNVRVNGLANFNTGANTALSLVDGVGSDSGKYVLSVKKSKIGVAATAGSVTIAGQGTYTGTGSNVIQFNFIDVNGSQTFDAGDILLSYSDTGATTAIPFAADGTYDLNAASTITVETTGTTAVDTSTLNNPLKAGAIFTVK